MLVWRGEYPWRYGRFYVAVVKSILLLGSDMWLVTPKILREMGSVHNWEGIHFYGRTPHQKRNIGWDYHTIGEELADAGLYMIIVYVNRYQNTMAQYISMWPILDIAVSEERMPAHQISYGGGSGRDLVWGRGRSG